MSGTNSLDAEIGGCAMLIKKLNRWVVKRVHESQSFTEVSFAHLHDAFIVGVLCTQVDRNRAPHPTSFCGCPVLRVCGAWWSGFVWLEGRAFSLSNDI